MPLTLAATLGLAWLRALRRPFLVSVVGMVVVSAVVLTGQVLGRAPAMPGPGGVVGIWLGLLPEMLGILVPVALLFASVSASHQWDLRGEFRALASAGVTTRSLLPANFILGVLLAVFAGLCSHSAGPVGRSYVRSLLASAVTDLAPSPGHSIEVGSVWVRGDDDRLVVASDEWVAWAAGGVLTEGLSISLEQGNVRALDGDWAMAFERASIPLEVDAVPPHNFERGHRQMWARIRALEAQGEDATRERLTVYKRTTVAALAPLMLLLGLPLGAMWRRPAAATLSVVLFVWVVQRIGDHSALAIGPSGGALLPLVLLSIVTWLLWVRWRAA